MKNTFIVLAVVALLALASLGFSKPIDTAPVFASAAKAKSCNVPVVHAVQKRIVESAQAVDTAPMVTTVTQTAVANTGTKERAAVRQPFAPTRLEVSNSPPERYPSRMSIRGKPKLATYTGLAGNHFARAQV